MTEVTAHGLNISTVRWATRKDMIMIITVKKALWLMTLFAFVSVTQAADFAGPRKCRGCHKVEYE